MRPHLLTLTLIAALAVPHVASAQDASAATLAADAEAAAPLTDAEAQADAPEDTAPTTLEPMDAADLTLDEFLWIARPIVVFADTPADPRFIEQLELLAARPGPLLERDAVLIIDTDPAARSPIRTALRPRGFSIVIVGKDGTVGLRRPAPRDVRELVRAIDNFQLRIEEIRRGE